MDQLIELGVVADPNMSHEERWSTFSANLNDIASTLTSSPEPAWKVVQPRGESTASTSPLDAEHLQSMDSESDTEDEATPQAANSPSGWQPKDPTVNNTGLTSAPTSSQQAASASLAVDGLQSLTPPPARPSFAKLDAEADAGSPVTITSSQTLETAMRPLPRVENMKTSPELTFADVFDLQSFHSPLNTSLPLSSLHSLPGAAVSPSISHEQSSLHPKNAAHVSTPALGLSLSEDALSSSSRPNPPLHGLQQVGGNASNAVRSTSIPATAASPKQRDRRQASSVPPMSSIRPHSLISSSSTRSTAIDPATRSGMGIDIPAVATPAPDHGAFDNVGALSTLSSEGEEEKDETAEEDSDVVPRLTRSLSRKRSRPSSLSPSSTRPRPVRAPNSKRRRKSSSTVKPKRKTRVSKPTVQDATDPPEGSDVDMEIDTDTEKMTNDVDDVGQDVSPTVLTTEQTQALVESDVEMEEFPDPHGDNDMGVSQRTTDDDSEGNEAPHFGNAESDTPNNTSTPAPTDSGGVQAAPAPRIVQPSRSVASGQPLQRRGIIRGPGAAALMAGLPPAYRALVEGLEDDELFEPNWALPSPVERQSRKKKGKKKNSTPQVQDQLPTSPLPRSWHPFTAGHLAFLDGNDEGDVRIQDGQFQFPFDPKVRCFISAAICCLL